MLTKDETASGAEHDDQSTDSVYDFLYHDARRIGSYLAQFENLGHLQQITASETAAKGTKHGFNLKLSGSIPVLGSPDAAEAGISYGRDPSQTGSEAEERVYDPLWTNALALLDYLDERGLIQRDIATAHLGQFVVASGELSILNAGLFPAICGIQAVRDGVFRNAQETARKKWNADPQNAAMSYAAKRKAEKAAVNASAVSLRGAVDILPTFPHSAQCTIKGKNFSVWSTLSADGMVGTVEDLSLKHGTDIPGEWHMLGVLDALPSPIPEQALIVNTGVPMHMGVLIRNLSNLGRTILGRAPEAYGMTALLLFRKVLTGHPGESPEPVQNPQ